MAIDLISRQAALEALLDKGQRSRRYKLGDVWELNFDEIREVIDALPAAEPKSYRMGYQAGYAAAQQWIPTSERPPKVREWVLCKCRAGIMDVLRLTEDGDWNKQYPYVEYMGSFVVAWMPLPKPYKGEK